MNKKTCRDSFVWWSSKESRDAGKVSVLAVVETIASVAGFWWLALAYSYELLLLTSVILAFFVLLRSPESVAMGLGMFEAYNANLNKPTKANVFVTFLVSSTCAGIMAWWLSTSWLVEYEGWTLFGSATCVGWLAIVIGFAATKMVAGLSSKAVQTTLLAIAVSMAVTVIVAVAEKTATTAVIAGAGVGAGAGGIIYARKIVGTATAPGGSVFSVFFMGQGVILGLALRITALRFWAALTHVHLGFPHFSDNWTTLAFKIDFCTPPELLPGLTEKHHLHFGRFFSKVICDHSIRGRIMGPICLVFFYLPSIFYRYYLKSTAWIYFPLIWIVRVPGQLRDANGGLLWDQAQRRSLLAWIGFVIASITVGLFIWRYMDPATIRGAIETVSLNSGLPAHPLLMFAGFGFANIYGLHLLPPAAAACGVAAFLWTNHIHTRVDRYPDQTPGQFQTRAILWLGNLTALLAYAWIATGVFELAWVSYEACQLPPFIQQGMGKLFAPAVCGA